MSSFLRGEMIIIGVLFVIGILRAVNRNKIRLQYSLIWLTVSIVVIVLAFFPDIIIELAKIMNIQASTNLLYLLSIIVLLIISFYLTIIVSQQSDKIQRIIQLGSIEQYLQHEKEFEKDEKNDEKLDK